MSKNTNRQTATRSSENTSNRIAGIASITVAAVITFVAVLIGEGMVHSQTKVSVLGDGLWLVSAGLITVFTVIATVFILMVALGLIAAIATPLLAGKTEYTLIGIGGLVGVSTAILISVATGAGITEAVGPDGSGESLLALAAVAAPLSYVFYELYKPDLTPIGNTGTESSTLDADVVREKTEIWSEEEPGQAVTKQHSTGSHIDSENTKRSTEPGENKNLDDESVSPSSNDLDLTEMEYRWVTETDVDFTDVGGMEELKDDLDGDVIKPLTTHREKAEKLGISAPNIIFHGPPGTGKTFVAKALATELELPFAQLSGADIQSKWINASSQKVKTLFEEAKDIADQEGGAVVFLDELDSVLKNRESAGSSHEEDNKVVNEFLNHLEDTEEHNVVFIGATNRLDSLDEAGIRSGRIDKKIHVGKPDMDARAAVLEAQLDQRPTTLTQDEIDEIARKTSGLVAADLELVVKTAAKQVLVRDGSGICFEDLETAVADVA